MAEQDLLRAGKAARMKIYRLSPNTTGNVLWKQAGL